MMDNNVEQTQSESAPIHSPSDWAKRLVESSKPADMEERSLAPQEGLSEEDVVETESEEPTSLEAHDEEEIDDDVVDALEEETEATEESELESSIIADGVYMIDGQEVSGQEVLNGLEATRNFGEEKHRLRVEAQEQLDADRGELGKQRDDYAAGGHCGHDKPGGDGGLWRVGDAHDRRHGSRRHDSGRQIFFKICVQK